MAEFVIRLHHHKCFVSFVKIMWLRGLTGEFAVVLPSTSYHTHQGPSILFVVEYLTAHRAYSLLGFWIAGFLKVPHLFKSYKFYRCDDTECALALDHMKQLGETPRGFSADPLFFMVSTPDALDAVVEDLPGPGCCLCRV